MAQYTVWNIPRSAWSKRPELENLKISDDVIQRFIEERKPDPREALFEERKENW